MYRTCLGQRRVVLGPRAPGRAVISGSLFMQLEDEEEALEMALEIEQTRAESTAKYYCSLVILVSEKVRMKIK